MIDLYFWPTPNGKKISIFLEEAALPYKLIPVDIGRGEQFRPEFLAISPNNRMPAIVDHEPLDGTEPVSVFESGAILLYLADKVGKFFPKDLRGRTRVIEWVMWQMGGVGPMFGQAYHFRNYAPEKIPYAIDRYLNEVHRLYGVLNGQLKDHEFIAGDYSIADMASWPWLNPVGLGQSFDEFPHLQRWYEAVKARPGVVRGTAVGADLRSGPMDDKAKAILFNQRAR
jgi:GST-like protein